MLGGCSVEIRSMNILKKYQNASMIYNIKRQQRVAKMEWCAIMKKDNREKFENYRQLTCRVLAGVICQGNF